VSVPIRVAAASLLANVSKAIDYAIGGAGGGAGYAAGEKAAKIEGARMISALGTCDFLGPFFFFFFF
jgi:hypothetical protein